MIDLGSVRRKIEELNLFNDVGNTTSAAEAIEEFVARPPAAYVSTASERAGANQLSTGHRQRVTQTISVLFVLGGESAASDNADEVEAVRRALIGTLTAWTPEGAASALEYGSYSLRAMADGLIWGELLFSAPYYVSQLP